mmetsp:Transcript_26299/g.39846  ORF Transcript_26299/g.39846 Transcript_26299/m.39846 type:complete len:91 (+) Transcript_26299:279-551(+)
MHRAEELKKRRKSLRTLEIALSIEPEARCGKTALTSLEHRKFPKRQFSRRERDGLERLVLQVRSGQESAMDNIILQDSSEFTTTTTTTKY